METKWISVETKPKIGKEVLVYFKYDEEPVQAYWDGSTWRGSRQVREYMKEASQDSEFTCQEFIILWTPLPQIPSPPKSER